MGPVEKKRIMLVLNWGKKNVKIVPSWICFLGGPLSMNLRKHCQKRLKYVRLMKCITASKKDQFKKIYMTSTGWGYFRAEINIQFPVCTMWRRLRGLGDLPNGLCHPHSTAQQIKKQSMKLKRLFRTILLGPSIFAHMVWPYPSQLILSPVFSSSNICNIFEILALFQGMP